MNGLSNRTLAQQRLDDSQRQPGAPHLGIRQAWSRPRRQARLGRTQPHASIMGRRGRFGRVTLMINKIERQLIRLRRLLAATR
jgi:hypothetical protein